MIRTRKCVPNYYEKSRDFQVFLKLLDLIINACKADIDHFVELLSPDLCKASLLPLLANYVGYDYDYAEKVSNNRIVIKNWPILIRKRGSEQGIRMAVALSISQIDDIGDAEVYQLFNVDFENYVDSNGRPHTSIKIYVFVESYISKLYELVEAVRPVGADIQIIPAVSISSSETIVLTDEYTMSGYDYTTGKLIRIGNIEILVENCWELVKDGNSTNEFLVDGVFYDQYHNPLNKRLDDLQNIVNDDGSLTGEYIRGYKVYTNDEEGTSQYTGKHFNLDHSARVLNTSYEILNSEMSTGYFVSADSWKIYNPSNSLIEYYLKDYSLSGKLVKKVFRITDDAKINWHLDIDTGYFVKDDDGEEVDTTVSSLPWDEFSYISKKRYIMNKTAEGIQFRTDYFVNKFEDIQDIAGNIILSKKDRYKVSDSTGIGFSEVHTESTTDHSHSWMQARQRSYFSDKDYYKNRIDKEDYNNYLSDITDNRIKIRLSDINLSYIVKEYDATNAIGRINLSNASLIPNGAVINIEGTKTDFITLGSWKVTPVIKGVSAKFKYEYTSSAPITKFVFKVKDRIISEWADNAGSVITSPLLFNSDEIFLEMYNGKELIYTASIYAKLQSSDSVTGDLRVTGYNGSGIISLNVALKPGDTIFSIFSDLELVYENETVGENKNIFINWKAASKAEKDYDISNLPDRLVISGGGAIKKRKLYFDSQPLTVTSKTYDGSTHVSTNNYTLSGGGE